MKLLIATIALWAWNSYGQTILHYPDTVHRDSTEEFELECFVYEFVDKEPHFPGGFVALSKYLNDNIVYHHDALPCFKGIVFIQFVVNKDGSISDCKLFKGLGFPLDEKVLLAVCGMPNWVPGEQNGKNVRTRFILPVKFS